MIFNTLFKSMFAVTLLMNINAVAIGDDGQAHEATAADAKVPFWELPLLDKAFINSAPNDRKDGLLVGELGVDGGNKDMIVKLAQEMADNKHGDYDSLLIAYKGKFLFESYYKRGRINLPHFLASGTKGNTALVVGRAIELGYLTLDDLHKPLVSFFKGLDATKFVKGVEKITLHQAMTMRSGLRFTDEVMEKFRTNSDQYKGLAQLQAFFELSAPVTSETQVYNYRGYDPIMVMHVLNAVVPGSAEDFIKTEFFGKLGISNYSWRTDAAGQPLGETGLNIMSRDLLKLGALVMNEGRLNGEQFLPADYLAKATSAITRVTEDWQPKSFFYGYLWYQTNLIVGDKSYDAKVSWGGGGNRIITIAALDLVVVITGHDMKDTIMTQVSNTILPAFIR
ncbi:serine hydrolase [Temperatibacter marinus]|uniref:Serine hydrolase n=1 Tax=Temperatibacter marinus TaxID=1456591 RepID=A0AA52EFI4_9PROT|nr:serine hydrolase [Temperatibacter marinus]WND03841.1 serine hydrolase [Temperatibacter marinus]